MARTVNLITLHCSATPSGQPISRGKPGFDYLSCAGVINAWHAARGFHRGSAACQAFNPKLTAIGYHFVIDVTGEVYTGRHVDEIGAHAEGFNAASLGICMVGGVELQGRFTPAQWKSLKTLVLQLMMDHGVPLAPPKRIGAAIQNGICGHRDLSPDTDHDGQVERHEWLKTCPGFDVSAWLRNNLQPDPANVYQEQQP